MKKDHCIHIDLQIIARHLTHESFESIFKTHARIVLRILDMAVDLCYFKMFPQRREENDFKIHVRLFNVKAQHKIEQIKAHTIGNFVFLQGTVMRIGPIKPLLQRMDFQCQKCEAQRTFEFTDGLIQSIVKCPAKNPARCKAKYPRPLVETAVCIDHQIVTILQTQSSDQSGLLSFVMDIELREDMVDACLTGDTVVVLGTVRKRICIQKKQNGTKFSELYIQAESLSKKDMNECLAGTIEFNTTHYAFIRKVLSERHLMKLLVNSLCPHLFGLEILKLGCLLVLLGGNRNKSSESPTRLSKDDNKTVNSVRRLTIRPNIHLCMVGDPGLGKSQLLVAIKKVAPRVVYVAGNTSTISGLTATWVQREDGPTLQAGALVQGDLGVCCIDEFDKMGRMSGSLLEAMEQQSVSIAKAGVVCTIPARTSIIAAANPIGGHFDKSKTIQENINMSGPLLSRFDLIFVLQDRCESLHDDKLAQHVMSRMERYGPVDTKSQSLSNGQHRNLSLLSTTDEDTNDSTLQERLALSYHESKSYDAVPQHLLRVYIAYARRYCHPKLTKRAKSILLKFYLRLRSEYQNSECTPLTMRQLESLIRLTEARARLEMREVADANDARDVIEVMKASIYDVCLDESDEVDFRRSKGSSIAGLRKDLIKLLIKLREERGTNRFESKDLLQVMRNCLFPVEKNRMLLQCMRRECILTYNTSDDEYTFHYD